MNGMDSDSYEGKWSYRQSSTASSSATARREAKPTFIVRGFGYLRYDEGGAICTQKSIGIGREEGKGIWSERRPERNGRNEIEHADGRQTDRPKFELTSANNQQQASHGRARDVLEMRLMKRPKGILHQRRPFIRRLNTNSSVMGYCVFILVYHSFSPLLLAIYRKRYQYRSCE